MSLDPGTPSRPGIPGASDRDGVPPADLPDAASATSGVDPLDPKRTGPIDRPTAVAMLARADELLAQSEFPLAGAYYQRVFGFDDPAISGAALYGIGNVLYRLDRDDEALRAWEQVTQLGESPVTYPAWRQVAAARVRAKDLPGAVRAYREAERRAPPQDRAEIASRLGWLAKEQGNTRAATRYFAASRGSGLPPVLTYGIIAVTCFVSLWILLSTTDGPAIGAALELDKRALAAGEYWRLLSPVLVHASLIHLAFNMYALYIAGTVVEHMYGWPVFGLMYVLAGAAGSVGSFVFGGDIPSVGASGAIFGLFGVLLAASRTHHPVLDRQRQALLSQIGALIVINLFLGFGINGLGGGIDNFAHIGGLVAGLWLGFILPPGQVQTLASLWRRPDGTPLQVEKRSAAALRALGVVALVVAIGVGVLVGTDARQNPGRRATAGFTTEAPVAVLLPSTAQPTVRSRRPRNASRTR